MKDFKSTSCWTPFAYGYLYLSLILSTTVYALDTFTAVNLLVFNKWSSEISPTISFTAAKWIFSVCIILSFLNLGYEHIRAQLVMRRGSVTECYLDNLAVRLESIRWGKGQGYKRFLVFASLTKSKKGAEYIALFTYFSFQCKPIPSLPAFSLGIHVRPSLTNKSQPGYASCCALVPARPSMPLPCTLSTTQSSPSPATMWRTLSRTSS